MRRPTSLLLLTAGLAVVAACASAEAPSDPPAGTANGVAAPGAPLALVGGTLIDGGEGPPVRNSVVLVRDGRIEQVGTVADTPVPEGYAVVDTNGMSVLPGLWDAHVHLLYAGHTQLPAWHETYTERFATEIMPATARQHLLAGVTSVRDLGAPPDAILSVRDRIAAGELEGPTVYAAGPQLNRSFPEWARFYRRAVADPEDAARVANALIDAGVDALKITNAEGMTVADIRAITDAAHARGVIVAAHGRSNAEIRMGLEGGVDEFEHVGLTGDDDAGYPPDLLAAIRARVVSGPPLYWTLTVGLALRGADMARDRELLDASEAYEGLPPDVAADVRTAVAGFAAEPANREAIVRKVRQLRDAGVEFLVGSDAGLAGNFHAQALWQEMDAWVRVLGIEPLEVIRRATAVPAAALGRGGEVGVVAPGQVADVIAVAGDPLVHMNVVRHPAVVIARGRRVR
ncbi:MAG: amidohydrolase family protein [Vicinamibacterales bacterium]